MQLLKLSFIFSFIIAALFAARETAVAQAEQQFFWMMNKNPYLLDQIYTSSPSVAYSVRKLKRSYAGFSMQVRRSSDNAAGDLAFDGTGIVSGNSLITITAKGSSSLTVGNKYTFSSFFSGTSVFVTTWYDQSGNGRNVVQATAGNQPRLVSGGTLEVSNAKASVRFINANATVMTLTLAASTMFNGGFRGTLATVLEASSGNTSAFGYSDGLSNRWQAHMNESGNLQFDVGNAYDRITYVNSANQNVLRTYALVTGTSLQQIWVSGAAVTSSATALTACTTSIFYLGGIPPFGGTWYHDAHQSEVIIYPINLANAEILKLYTNQKNFFGTP